MKGGMLLYKCRVCGKRYDNVHVPDVLMTVSALMTGQPLPKEWAGMMPAMLEIHACSKGKIGVADLIGGYED